MNPHTDELLAREESFWQRHALADTPTPQWEARGRTPALHVYVRKCYAGDGTGVYFMAYFDAPDSPRGYGLDAQEAYTRLCQKARAQKRREGA